MAGSFASSQGIVCSMYLLVPRIRSQIAVRATENCSASRASSTRSTVVVRQALQVPVVGGGAFDGRRDDAAEVLLHHRERPVEEVPQVVGQIAVDPLHETFRSEGAVRAEGDFPQQVVAKGVQPVPIDQGHRINDVAFRFGHFPFLQLQETVAEHFFRQGKPSAISMIGQ